MDESRPSATLTRDLSIEQRHHLAKMATPAHVAQYVTRELPDDAKWLPAKHLLCINQKVVEACSDMRQRFLQVAVSVRHGKSELLSVYLIFWFLGMFPDRQVFLISYTEEKAAQWGERVRDLMVRYGPELFGVTVEGGTNASKSDWRIKGRRGGMMSTGVGGGIIGIGADLCVIDDPIKNQEEAGSASARRKMREWYDGTLRSRFSPTCTTILTMARWHEDDLAGSLLSDDDPEMSNWEVINMPALAAPTKAERDAEDYDFEQWEDELGRHVGDPLWPEKWSLELLLKAKADISKKNPQFWDAQYQQDPTPLEGKMFKKANWVYKQPGLVDVASLRKCRFWDLAATDKRGDWTVGVLVGMDANNLVYILDIVRFRKEAAEVEATVKATAEKDGKRVPIRIEQERAGAGKAQISTYVRLLVGYDIDGVKAEGKKEERAMGLAAQHQNNRVVIVGSAADPMFATLIEEARTFPDGKNDDQIDGMVGGFEFLVGIGPTSMVAEELLDIPLERMFTAGLSTR